MRKVFDVKVSSEQGGCACSGRGLVSKVSGVKGLWWKSCLVYFWGAFGVRSLGCQR